MLPAKVAVSEGSIQDAISLPDENPSRRLLVVSLSCFVYSSSDRYSVDWKQEIALDSRSFDPGIYRLLDGVLGMTDPAHHLLGGMVARLESF